MDRFSRNDVPEDLIGSWLDAWKNRLMIWLNSIKFCCLEKCSKWHAKLGFFFVFFLTQRKGHVIKIS